MLKITEKSRKWWVLLAMSAALAMIFVDQSAVAVALPKIQRELDLSDTVRQWIVNAYLLTLATVLIFGGKLGGLIGRRRTFLIGISIFVIASISSALAQTGWWIILSRTVQGVGGALMIPTISATLISVFPENERGKAMGIYVGIASVFLSIGPLLGGVLTQYLSWRWIFWINFPIALFSIIMALILTSPSKAKVDKLQLDWLGFFWQAVAISALVIAFMEMSTYGWNSPPILILYGISLVGFILFYIVEVRSKDPLIDLSVFKNFTFTRCVLLVLIMQAAFICIIFWAIYLQNILNESPAMAGLLILPSTVPVMFMAPIWGNIRDKFGPKLPITVGTFLVMLSAIWISYGAQFQSYLFILPAFLIFGLGIPGVTSNTMTTGLSIVEDEQRGLASGILNAARQLGASLGLAILGSTMGRYYSNHLTNFLSQQTGTLGQLTTTELTGLLSHTQQSQQAISHLPKSEINTLFTAAEKIYTNAFSLGMIIVVGFALVGLLLAFYLPKGIDFSYDEYCE